MKEVHLSPVRENNVELLQEILRELDPFKHRSNTAAELASILTQPHFQVRACMPSNLDFKCHRSRRGPLLGENPTTTRGMKRHVCLFWVCQSLLETHDSVASQVCESLPPSPGDFVDHDTEDEYKHTYPPPDAIRMVGIRKVAGEHLVGRPKLQLMISERL